MPPRNGTKKKGMMVPVNRLPKETRTKTLMLPPLNIQVVKLRVVGLTPLIAHPQEMKVMQQLRSDDQVKVRKGRETPEDAERRRRFVAVPKDWKGWMANPKKRITDAFPPVCFKRAAVRGCKFAEGIDMVDANVALQVNRGEALVPLILDGPPEPNEDYPRIGRGVPDLRIRPLYFPWAVDLLVEFDADFLSEMDVFNLFNRGGRSGVGEKRPQKGFDNGMFQVASTE